MRSGITTKLHIKCPYCGGTVETVGGEDGDPFNIGRKARLVCSRCGRSVPNTEPDCFGDGDNADENGAYGFDIRPPHTGCLPGTREREQVRRRSGFEKAERRAKMKAETVLKLNGGDIAAAEERCAEWIKAYSAVAEEHPSAEEKAAKLIARAKNALDVIKTRAEVGAEPLYCKDEAYMEQVLAEEEQREAELDGEFPLGSEFDASFANPYFTTENLARIQLGYFNEVRTGVYYEHAEDVLVRQGILHELNGRWKEAERCYNGVSLSGSVLEREYYCRKKAESEGQRLYEKGLELIKNLNWSAAWYPLFAAAELGHSEAMAELGHMTVYGLGCGASADEGLEYLRRAAEAGSDYACRLIWELHDDGAGIVSGAEAERVCEAAAERGYERAKIRLEEGFDTRAYIDILQEDVDAGNVDALWLMANELLGNGEEDRAVEYMERAFQAGQIDALMMYGNIYANRNDELFDRAAAAECYKKAAEQGCAEACKALGDLALEEDDEPFWMIERVPENGSKELQLRHRAQFAGYLRAAELGLISAATAVSSAYHEGRPVERNDEKAFLWASRAADENDPTALYMMGFFNENGLGCEKDIAAALMFYTAAADKGVVQAMLRLADIYKNGIETEDADGNRRILVEPNEERAARYLFTAGVGRD